MGHSRPLFNLFSSFLQTVNNNCSIKVADDWIRTRVLWFWEATALPTVPQPQPLNCKSLSSAAAAGIHAQGKRDARVHGEKEDKLIRECGQSYKLNDRK